jgi:hypothetical protein
VTINGNLTLTGSVYTQTNFATPSLSEVKGNILATGGWYSDTFSANAFFKADKNITLKYKDGDNSVNIGGGLVPTSILGNYTYESGNGKDNITINNVAVVGKTSLKTGAGFDQLVIDNTTSFVADLGAGDDRLAIAQATGAATPVSFSGKTTIKTGDGNDTLLLGVFGGDLGQVVKFTVPGSTINGGTGYNTFDDELAAFTGLVLGTDILGWTDPT